MAKITIEDSLFDRAKAAAVAAGYSSIEEFVAHCLELELTRLNLQEAEEQVSKQLRGLGYIE